MLQKQEFPILEFDDNRNALICPYEIIRSKNKKFYNKLIITFFKDVIKKLISDNLIEEYDIISGENDVVVYKFKDCDTLIIHGVIGGPACGGFLEDLIGCGVTKVMFCGGGVLRKDITLGKFLVIDSAIRDEGF